MPRYRPNFTTWLESERKANPIGDAAEFYNHWQNDIPNTKDIEAITRFYKHVGGRGLEALNAAKRQFNRDNKTRVFG